MNKDLELTILTFLSIGYISLSFGVIYLWEINIPLSIGTGLVWLFGFIYGIIRLSGASEVGNI